MLRIGVLVKTGNGLPHTPEMDFRPDRKWASKNTGNGFPVIIIRLRNLLAPQSLCLPMGRLSGLKKKSSAWRNGPPQSAVNLRGGCHQGSMVI
ncbi:hypothetical protein ES703_75773 [subsurface metagenome]